MATGTPVQMTAAERKIHELEQRHAQETGRLEDVEMELDERNPDLARLRVLLVLVEGIRTRALIDIEETLPAPPANARTTILVKRRITQRELQRQAGARCDRAVALIGRIETRIVELERVTEPVATPPEADTVVTEPAATAPKAETVVTEPADDEEEVVERRRGRLYWGGEDRTGPAIVAAVVLLLVGVLIGVLIAGTGRTRVVTHTAAGSTRIVGGPASTATATVTRTVPGPSGGPVGGVHVDLISSAQVGHVSRIRVRGPNRAQIPIHTTLGWVYAPILGSGSDLNSLCGTVIHTRTLIRTLNGHEQFVCYDSNLAGTEAMTINGQTFTFAVAP